jgi:hypothetical protein
MEAMAPHNCLRPHVSTSLTASMLTARRTVVEVKVMMIMKAVFRVFSYCRQRLRETLRRHVVLVLGYSGNSVEET